MSIGITITQIDRARWLRLADMLAAVVAISMPWSTSATSILIVAWLIVLVPTLDVASVRREVFSAAGGLPILLWAFGAIGMLWADASLQERLGGLSSFHRLLVIPLLLAQFRRSENINWVLVGFLASCVALLVASGFFAFVPSLRAVVEVPGVPVKDYISQSGMFQICGFGLLYVALGKSLRVGLAILCGLLAILFFADIAYVASSRTAIAVMPVLIVLLGLRRFGPKGLLLVGLVSLVLGFSLWVSSEYLRIRVTSLYEEAQQDPTDVRQTSAGQRLEFWRKSLTFIMEAPVFGRGTGSINASFRKAAAGETGAASVAASNPHQQTLAVGIQLGFLGMAILWAMWIVHFRLFRGSGLPAWIGVVVVTQNIVGSLFNSHLFDFTQGWLYVFAVGIFGGHMLRTANRDETETRGSPAG